jgi:cellulose synthase/poly-beta-1,6-N-acetylglucosamine synthase-like glycosyltransferase
MNSIEIPNPQDRGKKYRAFEILPGVISWTVLFLPVIFGIFSPSVAAYFVLAYLLQWFVRLIAINIGSLRGLKTMREFLKLNWQELNADLEALTPEYENAPKWHGRNLDRVRQYMGTKRILPSEVYHAVIIAFYNESRDVVEPTVQSVINSDYDMKKVILYLAYEERGGPEVESMAKSLARDYGHHFYHAEAVKHPKNIEDEVIGKGGNITFAGRRLQKYLESAKIDPIKVLVTTLDSDNRPDKQYFSTLTYTYCSTEEPKYASYQPITMYLNNIWDAPAPMRVVATGNSFWNMMLSTRPHVLRNFSSHAQPMAALIETDFWSVRTIVEDGHQYWRTWFKFEGKHDVYPIFAPIYQDAVLTKSYKKTLRMQFKQVQRWAWGASDIAYVANQAFLKKNNIPLHKRLSKFFRLLEGHVSWATSALILALAAIIPFFLNPDSYIANQLPQIASRINQIMMVGILVTLYVCIKTLPPKPERYKRRRNFWMVIQWIYLPVTGIVYGAFAALNAQTRLMFKRYLGFNVTEKATKSERLDVAKLMKS